MKLTLAEAKALGLVKPAGKRKTKKSVPVRESAPVRCHACGEVFTTQAAEDRHFQATNHRRYEAVLDERNHP